MPGKDKPVEENPHCCRWGPPLLLPRCPVKARLVSARMRMGVQGALNVRRPSGPELRTLSRDRKGCRILVGLPDSQFIAMIAGPELRRGAFEGRFRPA
ncbi:MAG: hypothetical protein ACRDPD_24255 [Streptosporangiaceae bacterium]